MKTSAHKTTSNWLEHLHSLLDRERALTLDRIKHLRREQAQDATPLPGDTLDEARSLAEIETHAGLIERAEARLKAIDDALSRVERNSYGLCERCGNEIPRDRLRVLPLAAYCIDCKRKSDDANPAGTGAIDEASRKHCVLPREMDESLETQDSISEPEDRLFVRDNKPRGRSLENSSNCRRWQRPGGAVASNGANNRANEATSTHTV
jgi:DnaK suppressor protein